MLFLHFCLPHLEFIISTSYKRRNTRIERRFIMTLLERINESREEFISLRRKIHAHPETAFEEVETTKLIQGYLTELGIENFPNGDKTGVVGLLKGKKAGPVLAIRADIDALNLTELTGLPFASAVPGKCHACGHDIHTSVLLGTAKILKSYKEDLCGTVKFLFQPAEEGLGGSRMMIANGVLDNPKVEYMMACHTWPDMPAGSIGVRKGTMLGASDHFTIRIIGKGAHAAHPQKGIDPVVIAAYIITGLQTIVSRRVAAVDPAVITVGRLEAGTAGNIIPDKAFIEGTVRTQSAETRTRVSEMLKEIAIGTAKAMGANAEVDYIFGVGPTVSNPKLVEELSSAAAEILGKERILQVPVPSMGGEDFANYLEHAPGVIFRLGTHNEKPETKLALHNASLIFDEESIPTGIAAMTAGAFKISGSDMRRLLD